MMFAGLCPPRTIQEISLMKNLKNLIYGIGLVAAVTTISTGCATLADAQSP